VRWNANFQAHKIDVLQFSLDLGLNLEEEKEKKIVGKEKMSAETESRKRQRSAEKDDSDKRVLVRIRDADGEDTLLLNDSFVIATSALDALRVRIQAFEDELPSLKEVDPMDHTVKPLLGADGYAGLCLNEVLTAAYCTVHDDDKLVDAALLLHDAGINLSPNKVLSQIDVLLKQFE
jgi:hypothetical protein